MDFEQKYYQLVYDLTKNYERQTPTKIRQLRPSQVFVFGTDRRGSQRLGAAGFAARCCGAAVGVTEGLTGSAYALPTQGYTFRETIEAIGRFVTFAKENTSHIFMGTPIGWVHAGLTAEKIAPFFRDCLPLNNVWLPYDFVSVYRKEAIEALGLKQSTAKAEEAEDVFTYYDKQVHSVIRFLIEHNIQFNPDGGFCLKDEDDMIIAEAELGIESEKIVFYPFNSQSEIAFKNNGYKIYTEEEYLNSKNNSDVF